MRLCLPAVAAVGASLAAACCPTVAASALSASPVPVALTIDLTRAIAQIPVDFLSTTMDSQQIPNAWDGLDFTSPALFNLARELAPCLLRIGGTAEDETIYDFDEESSAALAQARRLQNEPIHMPVTLLQQMTEFAGSVGWKVVFGLNLLTRNDDGSWDSSQAEKLIALTSRNTTRFPMHAFELGNEPEGYLKNFKTTANPAQMARDYVKLHELVQTHAAPGVELWGIDSGAVKSGQIFNLFLRNLTRLSGGADVLQAATVHHYYGVANKANLTTALDVSVLDKLRTFVSETAQSAADANYTGKLIMGETSSFAHGGIPGVSDAFSAGFMWLDKLGILAESGYERVFRQTFIGGAVPPFHLTYALLSQQIQPHPDYFSSVLFKRLVGTAVLALKQIDTVPELRAYAFCTSSRPSVSLPNEHVQKGSVTVMWMSLHTDQAVELDFGVLSGKSASSGRLDFVLSPNSTTGVWETDVVAMGIRLNGDDLSLLPGGIVPLMVPHVHADGAQALTVQPLTYGFAVFPGAAAPACGYKSGANRAHVHAPRKHRS